MLLLLAGLLLLSATRWGSFPSSEVEAPGGEVFLTAAATRAEVGLEPGLLALPGFCCQWGPGRPRQGNLAQRVGQRGQEEGIMCS